MEKILLIGFGGHAHSVIDSIIQKNEYDIVGYVDKEEHGDYLNIKYIGNDNNLKVIHDSGVKKAAVCIGFLGNSNIRNSIYDELKKIGFELPAIIDKTAIIANNVEIGEGTFVGKGAVINANSMIGKMCIINSKSLVEHDCEIDDFAHIAVSACLCGEVAIGKNSFVGANSTIVQNLKIGKNVFIGAGMLVVNNIQDNKRFTQFES